MDKEKAEVEKLVDELIGAARMVEASIQTQNRPGQEYWSSKLDIYKRELLAALTSSLDVEACANKIKDYIQCVCETGEIHDVYEEIKQILTSHMRPTGWSKEKPTEPKKYRLNIVVEVTEDSIDDLVAHFTTTKGKFRYLGRLDELDGEWQPIK